MRRSEFLVSYNVDNYRSDQDQLACEVQALVSDSPLALVCVETIGNRMPKIPGYHKIEDDSSASRANITAYVRRDAAIAFVRWTDLSETWERTQGPGIHPPRSLLTVVPNDIQVTAVHQCPKGTSNTMRAQEEGITAITQLMHRGPDARVAVALGDFNRRKREPGPGPDSLAAAVGGKVVGTRIDCAVVRGAKARAKYVTKVAGVTLLSDHRRALRLEVSL